MRPWSPSPAQTCAAVLSKSEVNRRVLIEIASFVADHRDTYGALLARGDEFARSVAAAFADQALATLRTRETLHADPEITARYMGAGLIGVLSWWLESEDDRSPEDLARALHRDRTSGLHRLTLSRRRIPSTRCSTATARAPPPG